jgi:23S rRNA (uracil1939-C5)-methyltransferase
LKKTFDLTITDYSKKGHGLALLQRQEGQPPIKVEVVSAAIGDKLEVALGKRKKGAYQGTLLKLLQASSDRTEPQCVHAGSCGGCSWQGLKYTAQLQQKEDKVRKLFAPYLENATFYPIIPCEEPWQYRNKMEFTFSENKDGERFLGLIMTRSRGKVLTMQECHLTSPWFTAIRHQTIKWWESRSLKAFHPPSGTGSLRTITLREGKRTGDKMIFLTVSGDHEYFVKQSDLDSFKQAMLKALSGENPSIYLRIHKAEKGRPTAFYEMHLHGPDGLKEELQIKNQTLKFHISPASFFQPNTLQAEKLFARALDLASPDSSMRVYDLYAGSGSLGMVFAPYVKKVLGIELCAYAVCDAETNIEQNSLSNMKMIRGDVGEVLSEFQLTADLAIVDPPRTGLDAKALENILRLSPKKILYVSCNPTTQSENIFELTKRGYKLTHIQPVDQFPHTPHIENICVLEK